MHIETVREYSEKKHFFEHFLEILTSKFRHSDTLKNEIPWTLTNDKNFFQVARFQKTNFDILQT